MAKRLSVVNASCKILTGYSSQPLLINAAVKAAAVTHAKSVHCGARL
jgi:hypothetical protein